jgi:putative membrane protein
LNTRIAQPRGAKSRNALLWLLALGAIAAALVQPFVAPQAGPMPVFVSLILFSLVHGTLRYGGRHLVVFIVICLVVSNIYENVSILTGFPFGHYHYTGGGKLFHVPMIIGPFYFAIGYSSWQVASILLDGADGQLRHRINLFALPVVAALVMTMFDLATDANASTIMHAWVWHDGGGFYGVPYTNFLGWALTTWTFFQLFAFYLASRPGVVRPAATRSFFTVAVVGYASLGLNTVAQFVANTNTATVVDAAGVSWQVPHILEAGLLCAIFTVLSVATVALIKAARGDVRV